MEGAGGRVFLLSPALLGLGSGRLLGGWLSSGLGLLAFALALAWLASGLGASAAVVEVAAVASLARLAALAALTSLVLLVLLAVPHRSGTGWTSGGGMTWSEASVVVLPHWFVALVWTSLVLVTFSSKVWRVAPSARVRGPALLLLGLRR